ncbi:hypothetical protein KFK09_007170 [Dendrobium nobile]|uniref:CCHC-type domain-containing protein n=1 Tax=Dendrobium nobile TaxID=94219 RepID=A0A8T3BVR0_DENNO|nr:hypothetical protein KFK09_007170 [Dendrobium nobile]
MAVEDRRHSADDCPRFECASMHEDLKRVIVNKDGKGQFSVVDSDCLSSNSLFGAGNSNSKKMGNGFSNMGSQQWSNSLGVIHQGVLRIKENSKPSQKQIKYVEGKGKAIAILVNRFMNWNAIPGPSRSAINENSLNSGNDNIHSALNKDKALDVVKVVDALPKPVAAAPENPWSNKPYIKLDFNDKEVVLSEDGKAVKLIQELEEKNSNRLFNSLVVKVFGNDLPSNIVAWELRKQWKFFGQFHFTTLGKGWFLCSFTSEELVEAALSGGPWFVNEHVIGMEKWSPKFNSSSTEGLTTPIWIRMPHLPLQCWDEKNVACIASRIGTALMLDGNIFHWGRREFSRVCVRIKLNQPLPLGVWVDSMGGRFFQKVVYEKVSNFCFTCGNIGHVDKECISLNKVQDILKAKGNGEEGCIADKEKGCLEDPSYRPWIFVNNKKKNFSKLGNKKISSNAFKYVKKKDVPLLEEDREEGAVTMEKEGCLDNNVSTVIQEVNSESLQKVINTGAKKKEASLYLKDFIKEWDVFFVGIVETKLSSLSMEDFNKMMGKDWNFFLHPSRGNLGGIMVIWNSNVEDFTLLHSSDQCILGDLEIFNKFRVKVATIYGSREVQGRRDLWIFLDGTANIDSPFIAGGDFNCILSQDERKGGKKFSFLIGPLEMKSFMNRNDLHDVSILGSKFTWCNNKRGSARILERLDRCLLNSKALDHCNQPSLRHLNRIASDHCPIVLKMFNLPPNGCRICKFEDVWLSYAAASSVVKFSWAKPVRGDDMEALNKRLSRVLKALFFWSKAKHQKLEVLKENLKKDIEELQLEEASDQDFSASKGMILRNKISEFNSTLARLNTWWRQRAKANWLKEGYLNSSFFHSFSNGRRNANFIRQLKKEDGVMIEDSADIRDCLSRFFMNKWKYRSCILSNWPVFENVLNQGHREALEADFTLRELESVIKDLGNNIAPRLDGITYSFFKSYWSIVGKDVWKALQLCFSSGKLSSFWKETLVILVPKVRNPLAPSNFRLKSLCLSIYKIVAKILLNRLMKVIHYLISEEQAVFIKNRSLSDHMLLAHEPFHKFRISKSKRGMVALKLDMEQAYDSMAWDTLKQILVLCGFPSKFSNLIMDCVTNPAFLVQVNGVILDKIVGKSAPSAPRISHLLYADDILIFSNDNEGNLRIIKKIMMKYCSWTGQVINTCKSSIIFSKVMRRRRKRSISLLLGIKEVKEFSYLGNKIALRQLVEADFSFILEKSAGKMNVLCRDFLWDKCNGVKGLHFIAWNEVCRPVNLGGLGINSAVHSVKPLRAKLAWKVLNMPNSLLSRTITAKYGNSILNSERKQLSSSSWKIILSGEKALKQILRWRIKDGTSISVLKDIWLLDRRLESWPTFISSELDNLSILSSFITEGNWNVEVLHKYCADELVNQICKLKTEKDYPEDILELLKVHSGKTISSMVKTANFDKDEVDISFLNIWKYLSWSTLGLLSVRFSGLCFIFASCHLIFGRMEDSPQGNSDGLNSKANPSSNTSVNFDSVVSSLSIFGRMEDRPPGNSDGLNSKANPSSNTGVNFDSAVFLLGIGSPRFGRFNAPLVFKEPTEVNFISPPQVCGKGKEKQMVDDKITTPLKSGISKSKDFGSSSSNLKIFSIRFGKIPKHGSISEGIPSIQNKDFNPSSVCDIVPARSNVAKIQCGKVGPLCDVCSLKVGIGEKEYKGKEVINEKCLIEDQITANSNNASYGPWMLTIKKLLSSKLSFRMLLVSNVKLECGPIIEYDSAGNAEIDIRGLPKWTRGHFPLRGKATLSSLGKEEPLHSQPRFTRGASRLAGQLLALTG